MNLISISKFIVNHPLNKGQEIRALFRFFRWQIRSRLINKPQVVSFTDKSKLSIEKGMTGATGNLYCGLHEFNDMAFVLHFLREGDLFIDIGANIGSYTILASAHCKASSISFEPLPATFEKLLININLNGIDKLVRAHNIALGEKAGHIEFTNSLDTANHVATQSENNTTLVKANVLDDMIHSSDNPILLKIDVEGFETEVFKGGMQTLSKPSLRAVIIELNGSGSRYGYDENLLHQQLLQLGFTPHEYKPMARELQKVETYGDHNTIYLKDLDFVRSRLLSADKVQIRNHSF